MTAVLLHPQYKNLLLSASADGVVRVWDATKASKPMLEVRGDHAAPVKALVAYSRQFASASEDGRVVVTHVKTRCARAQDARIANQDTAR